MKTLYCLLFTILLFQIQAQSWCTPGSTWYYSLPQPGDGYTKYTYLYDTLIASQSCNKIKVESNGHGMGGFPINYTNYIYTYEQNGVVFKNNGTLIAPIYDTLYCFNGIVGTKWRCQLTGVGGGSSCANSYVEITDIGSLVIQGQIINWREIFYKNYYLFGQTQQWIESGTDTIFERIGTRHNMEFISGSYCADVTDVTPLPFRCFSDNQINLQMTAQVCDFTTSIEKLSKNHTILEVSNPASDLIYVRWKSLANTDTKHVVLINQLGANVYDQFLIENEFTINAQNFQNGIYILQISSGNEVVSRKLVIQK
jgi:hypothetical protein